MTRLASWPAWAFSALFVTSQALGSHIVFGNQPESLSLGDNYIAPWSFGDIILIVMGIPLVALGMLAFDEVSKGRVRASARSSHTSGTANTRKRTRKGQVTKPAEKNRGWARPYGPDALKRRGRFVAIAAGVLLVAWLPYLLGYFPGGLPLDTVNALAQGPGSWDTHQPLGFTLIAKSFLALGVALGSPNLGVFAYVLVQMTIMAFLLGYGVFLLAKHGTWRIWCAATLAFFALLPAFPMFAVTMVKDVPFSLAILGLSYFVLAVVESRGELLASQRGSLALLFITVLGIALRSNGVYVVGATTILLAIAYGRRSLPSVIPTLALLLAVVLLQGPMYRALGVNNESAATESVGIGLQQIACTIDVGGEIKAEEREFLGQLLPLHMWTETYSPSCVDPLKSNADFNKTFLGDNMPRFLTTWAQIVIRNPVPAIHGYSLQTFGFWKVFHDHPYWAPWLEQNELGIYPVDLLEKLTGYSAWETLIRLVDYTPGKGGGFPSEGIFIWVILASLTVMALRGAWTWALVFVPCLAVWLTVMVAAPVAYGLRYVLILAIVAPAFALLPFYVGES